MHLFDEGEIAPQRGKNKGEEYNESAKRKFENTLQKYFEWRSYTGDIDSEWDSGLRFTDEKAESASEFTERELGLIFEQAESYGSLPSYDSVSEQERTKINNLVSQRLRIPKDKVTRQDWLRADNGTHNSSLVRVGYDAGLSPKEVRKAEESWYDAKRQILRIPTEHACKKRKKEQIALADDTAETLSKWMKERRHLKKYDKTEKIWLNREGNPYESGSLCRRLRNICTEAGINIEDRKIVWTSLRETLGTYLKTRGGMFEANDQLRHDSLDSTRRYGNTAVEKRQAVLNGIHESAKTSAGNPDYNSYEDQPVKIPSQQTSSPENVDDIVTPTDDGSIHIDAVVKDTLENRIDVSTQILDEEDKK